MVSRRPVILNTEHRKQKLMNKRFEEILQDVLSLLIPDKKKLDQDIGLQLIGFLFYPLLIGTLNDHWSQGEEKRRKRRQTGPPGANGPRGPPGRPGPPDPQKPQSELHSTPRDRLPKGSSTRPNLCHDLPALARMKTFVPPPQRAYVGESGPRGKTAKHRLPPQCRCRKCKWEFLALMEDLSCS